MRSFLLITFLLVISQLGRAQTLNVFMSTTDCSAYGACDGTITLWVEGASAADSFAFLIDVAPAPVMYDTIIVSDTIVTLDSICAGSYTVTLDTLWGSCPSYGGCCNCVGSTSCSGSPGGGATGTVGQPLPPLLCDATAFIIANSPCVGIQVNYTITASGGVPPYQVIVGWQGSNNNGVYPMNGNSHSNYENYFCSPPIGSGQPNAQWWYTPPYNYWVQDAAGQTCLAIDIGGWPISGSWGGQYGVDYCVTEPYPIIQDIVVCSGETVAISATPDFQGQTPTAPNYSMYSWDWGINTTINFPNGVSNTGGWPGAYNTGLTDVIYYTAPVVSSTTTEMVYVQSGYNAYNGYYNDNCAPSNYFSITVHPLPTVDAGPDQVLCEGNTVTLSGNGANTYSWDNAVTDGLPFVPPLGTTQYNVVGTDVNGCQGADQVELVVNPSPIVNAGADQVICEGTSIILSATGASNRSWDNGVVEGISFTPPVGTNVYTVTAFNQEGCITTDEVVVTVTPLPAISAGLDQNVCEGDQVVLSGMGGVNYSWNNGVVNNIAFIPLLGTMTYEVSGTDANGCSNVDQVDVTVNAPPTIDAGVDQVVCDGDQVTLVGSGGVSYTWSNGIIDNVAFVPLVGSTTYQVTGTDANGCSNMDLVNITVNPLPGIGAGVDQVVCDGNQIILSGSGGISYTWDNGISDSIAFVPLVGSTTYQVTGIDANGCSNVDQVNVTVNSLPGINAGIDQTVCDGDLIVLFASGGISYSWSNGVSDGVSFVPVLGTTTYSVSGTDANGCSNVDQVDVTVNPLPIIDAGVDQVVCDGDQVILSGSGGVSYTWNNGISDNITFVPLIGVTTYEVMGTDANGCSNADQVDVTVDPLPIINAGLDQTVCDGDQVILLGSGGVNYTWNNGVIDGIPFTPVLGITAYEVIGTDLNGCQNSDQVDINTNSLPVINPGSDQTICEGEEIILFGSGGVNYTWNSGVMDSIPFVPIAGTNVYTVLGVDINGCENVDSVVVVVEPVPNVSFVGSPLEGCAPLNIELTNTTLGTSIDCIWEISNGTVLTGCGTVNTQLVNSGYYSVNLTVSTLGGCLASGTYVDYIYVEPDPIAHFTFPPNDFTTLHPEVQFTNQSLGASSYWWNFNDSSSGTNEIHPLHQFPDQAMTYIIDLTAYSDLGCIDSTQASISIREELIYYIPNSFSPDGDEHNNVFQPVFHSGFDPYSFEMRIYNRWGEVIFISNDTAIGWDGTYLGNDVQDGVYTWTVKFKAIDNDEYFEERGHVNLLR